MGGLGGFQSRLDGTASLSPDSSASCWERAPVDQRLTSLGVYGAVRPPGSANLFVHRRKVRRTVP
jgi:hypothetical protein